MTIENRNDCRLLTEKFVWDSINFDYTGFSSVKELDLGNLYFLKAILEQDIKLLEKKRTKEILNDRSADNN